jgi:hypothetical protein
MSGYTDDENQALTTWTYGTVFGRQKGMQTLVIKLEYKEPPFIPKET